MAWQGAFGWEPSAGGLRQGVRKRKTRVESKNEDTQWEVRTKLRIKVVIENEISGA